MADTVHQADHVTLFEAVIVPHRSLSPFGMRILLCVIGGSSALIAGRFWLMGAWPVVAFSLVETAGVALLLFLNHRSGRVRELVLLNRDQLRVVRTDPSGTRRERVLPSAWLNVQLEEEAGRTPRLMVGTRTMREEIGAVLGETEKRDLAAALKMALHDARNPRFDNPQLRT